MNTFYNKTRYWSGFYYSICPILLKMDIVVTCNKRGKGMNISLAEKERKYILKHLLSGNFKSASEVVQDALYLHELYSNSGLRKLREEIAKGWDSPTSERSLQDVIDAKTQASKA